MPCYISTLSPDIKCPDTPPPPRATISGIVANFLFVNGIVSFSIGTNRFLWTTPEVPDWMKDGASVSIEPEYNHFIITKEDEHF